MAPRPASSSPSRTCRPRSGRRPSASPATPRSTSCPRPRPRPNRPGGGAELRTDRAPSPGDQPGAAHAEAGQGPAFSVMQEHRPARVDALSGLRFAAAAGILLFHAGKPLLAGAPAWAERIRAGGYVWVGLFYLLSGFVLAHAHPTPMDAPARREFLVARLARLYPAY